MCMCVCVWVCGQRTCTKGLNCFSTVATCTLPMVVLGTLGRERSIRLSRKLYHMTAIYGKCTLVPVTVERGSHVEKTGGWGRGPDR